MKLDAKKLKQMIQEVLDERRSDSMLLEEPNIDEMATGQSVADRVTAPAYGGREDRQAEEFVVMSSDRGERNDAENKKNIKNLNKK